jgi:hypothetical protein
VVGLASYGNLFLGDTMSLNDVEIANMALAKIGSDSFITSFDDGTKASRHISIFYNPIRDSLIRSHLWRFARKQYQLAPLVDQPLFDGGYYFQIPTDCLRVVTPDEEYFKTYGRWSVEGDKILADTNVLNIVGLQRVTNTALFDSIFTEALATKLAHELCMPMAQSESLKNVLRNDMREIIIRAAHVGATEQDSQKFISEVLVGSRL